MRSDDLMIVSNTTVHGTVNDERYEGSIRAEFNPERGGVSRCEFSALPKSFTPATLNTHT